MKEISAKQINENPIKLISSMALLTVGDEKKYNTMTVSWGGVGELWGKDVVFVFVRPQRYTKEFIEKNDLFTLSFYNKEYNDALVFCGRNSGRDVDKAAKTGLTPLFTDATTTFKQAKLTMVCKKIAKQDFDPKGFLDESIMKNYPQNDFHTTYVGEIVKVLIDEKN